MLQMSKTPQRSSKEDQLAWWDDGVLTMKEGVRHTQ